jgi:maltose alpha-D-glucosyltransferase/alpha-amylase
MWADEEPADRRQGMVFPGVQKETWTFDEEAGAWYFHRFYDFQPDLNLANPQVRAELRRIVAFWLQLGVAGFRMDAVPFLIELTRPGDPNPPTDFTILDDLYDTASWRRGDAVLLAEANVEKDELPEYFGGGHRLPMMFNFLLNQRTFLALARADASPVLAALEAVPALAPSCQWATFLRNHDEVDLGRLGERERDEVFAAFGPEPEMRLYDRGIRRRLAPMLGGDRRRIEMAYALQCTLPGTPVIRYGEEIGMGDDLSLPERDAIRTPMQWSAQANAGFSTARAKDLCRPVVTDGPFGYEAVNVLDQRLDPNSLLTWMERMLHALRECPEFGVGTCEPLDVGHRAVLGLRFEASTGVMLALTNLGPKKLTVDAGPVATDQAVAVFADRDYGEVDPSLVGLELDGYGYRWLRLASEIPSGPPLPHG